MAECWGAPWAPVGLGLAGATLRGVRGAHTGETGSRWLSGRASKAQSRPRLREERGLGGPWAGPGEREFSSWSVALRGVWLCVGRGLLLAGAEGSGVF